MDPTSEQQQGDWFGGNKRSRRLKDPTSLRHRLQWHAHNSRAIVVPIAADKSEKLHTRSQLTQGRRWGGRTEEEVGTEGRKEARVAGAVQAKEMLAHKTILAVMRSWLCVRAVLADGQSGKSSTRFPKVTADTRARWTRDSGVRQPTCSLSWERNFVRQCLARRLKNPESLAFLFPTIY